ncbi:hypothetical protein JSO54_06160 [Riemerella anatipestifer]|uniref:hypothetical protein n=1 Tax=Riemerella anatipestifer TaxID=34085 RepID=UPI00137520D4|nr:hypothetical protein [Riemerella anatipestifer]
MSFCLETKGRKIQEQRLGLPTARDSPCYLEAIAPNTATGAVPKLTFAPQSVDNS